MATNSELISSATRTLMVRHGPLISFCLLFVAYHWIFYQFYPNSSGRLGHDYSLALPGFLAGYYWFQSNGFWDVPWFTPAFCGGQPFFADGGSGYYSVLQLLTLVADPLWSAYLATLLFAALGYWACFLLLRRCFQARQEAAILGAAIFMFNGFVAHRMIVAHLGYQGFMLIPWMALFLLWPWRSSGNARLQSVTLGCLAGLVGSYWVQSGFGSLIVPGLLSILLIVLIHAITEPQWHLVELFRRSLIGFITMVSISASRVVSGFSFLANFPRSDYLLAGYRSVADAAEIAFLSLFVSPVDIAQRSDASLMNVQWAIGRHELEYGVTWVPLLLVIIGAGIAVWRIVAGNVDLRLSAMKIWLILVAAVILCIPIALNTYSPGWNSLIKQVPLLKSASTFVRWNIIYIPFMALVSALFLDRCFGAMRTSVAIVAVALVVALNLMQDRRSYAQEAYDPEPVIQAYQAVRQSAPVPAIQSIGVYRDRQGNIVHPLHKNDALTQGYSSLYCYNPAFGYGLEKFPVKDLHPGPVRDVRDGHYNIKNPACYVYPKENNCSPGDHFRETQREEMEKFVSYRPFAFNISTAQKAANALTLLGLAVSVLVVLAAAAVRLFDLLAGARRSPKRSGPI